MKLIVNDSTVVKLRYRQRTFIPLGIAVGAVITLLIVIVLNSISQHIMLPLISWLVIPLPFATVILGVFIVIKGWTFTKFEWNGRLVGILIVSAGVIISLVGVGGLLFLFMPLSGGYSPNAQ